MMKQEILSKIHTVLTAVLSLVSTVGCWNLSVVDGLPLSTPTIVPMSDGETAKGALTWEEVTEDIYNAPGEYTINGVLSVGIDCHSCTSKTC